MPSSVRVFWAMTLHAALYAIFVFAYALFIGDRAGALFIIANQAFGYLGMGWLKIAAKNHNRFASVMAAVFVLVSIICAAVACAHVAFWRG